MSKQTQKPMEANENKTAEAKKQEIISITEATVAAYSNAPVWYKQEIEKYMDTYASTLQKELDELRGYGIEPFSATEDDDPKLIDAYDLGAKRMRIRMLDKYKEFEKELDETKQKLQESEMTIMELKDEIKTLS